MSHASIPAEVRDSVNVPSDTVRLSVGIEDSEDLISDLDEAFRLATTKSAPGAVSQEHAAAD
jgi:cystathionine beta-lyase/cystathionine gamma-synthase